MKEGSKKQDKATKRRTEPKILLVYYIYILEKETFSLLPMRFDPRWKFFRLSTHQTASKSDERQQK